MFKLTYESFTYAERIVEENIADELYKWGLEDPELVENLFRVVFMLACFPDWKRRLDKFEKNEIPKFKEEIIRQGKHYSATGKVAEDRVIIAKI